MSERCENCCHEPCVCVPCALCGAKVHSVKLGARPICGYCAMCAEPEEEVEMAVRSVRK